MTFPDKGTQDNKQLVRSAFEALSSGDSRPFVGLLADDVTWKVMGQTPWSREYHGKASVLADLLRPLGARLATPYRAHVHRIICDGSPPPKSLLPNQAHDEADQRADAGARNSADLHHPRAAAKGLLVAAVAAKRGTANGASGRSD